MLDLGSGTGKICFIAAQVVGEKGRVIGVDMTDDMLEVARRHTPIVAERLGYANVEFRKGRIQDLALDLEKLDAELMRRPITNAAAFLAADELAEELRITQPLVASDSVDVVVSNCVLNLVEPRSKRQLFDEIFRVLRKGGFVKAARGKEGGYTLARPAEEIVIGDVMDLLGGRIFESDFCASHSGQAAICTRSVDCSVRSLWRAIQTAVDQVLRKATLRDLLQKEEEMNSWVRSIPGANGLRLM